MTSATFYLGMSVTALELLTEFGTTVTLHRTAGESVDPVTGTVTAGTDVSVLTTGVLMNYEEKAIDNVAIMQGDRQLILSSEQEPLATDNPVIGGERWSIVDIQSIKPDGATPVIYTVQVRR